MIQGSLETKLARKKVKQALNDFFKEMELEIDPLPKDASQPQIRRRIKSAHFYLGDITKDQNGAFNNEFLRRLEHPKATHLNTRGQLLRGEIRRRRRRDSTPKGKAMKLYKECMKISNARPRYVYGGGHGPLLRLMRSSSGMDCSSSTSLALKRAGFFSSHFAWVSWLFGGWGESGTGKYFTVWYHSGHVWIEFYGLGEYTRFDTSPWGYGEHGARMRKGSRGKTDFRSRHLPRL